TGVKEDKLTTLLYHPTVPTKTNFCDYSVFGALVPRYFIRPLRPKVCPNCLQDSAYVRKIWDLAIITVCPVHRCLLLDVCPNCEKSIPWVRARISCCRCDFDLRKCKTASVAEEDLAVARQIYLH